MEPDHYEILGIPRDASAEEIRRAYKRLQRQVHPDLGGTDGVFILVQAAWEVLSNPASRAAYDRSRSGPSRTGPDSGRFSNHDEREREQREREQREREQREREKITRNRQVLAGALVGAAILVGGGAFIATALSSQTPEVQVATDAPASGSPGAKTPLPPSIIGATGGTSATSDADQWATVDAPTLDGANIRLPFEAVSLEEPSGMIYFPFPSPEQACLVIQGANSPQEELYPVGIELTEEAELRYAGVLTFALPYPGTLWFAYGCGLGGYSRVAIGTYG